MGMKACFDYINAEQNGVKMGDGKTRKIKLEMFDDAMERLVEREARMALRAYQGAPAEDLSRMVEQSAPIVGRLLVALHRKRLRRFLAEFGAGGRRHQR